MIVGVTPLYQQPHIFRLSADTWKQARGVDKWIAFNDHSPEETVEIAREFMEVLDSGEEQKSNYVRDGGDTHVWDVKTLDRMSRIRNRILRHVATDPGCSDVEYGTQVLMLDSDILLAPYAVEILAGQEEALSNSSLHAVISPIFWSKWKKDQPPLPQVWDYHPYGFEGVIAERLRELKTPGLYKVRGLGAVSFFDMWSLNPYSGIVDYSPIESLRRIGGLMTGEDRWFCIRAEVAGLELLGLATDPPIAYHIYRDEDLAGIAEWKARVGLSGDKDTAR